MTEVYRRGWLTFPWRRFLLIAVISIQHPYAHEHAHTRQSVRWWNWQSRS